MRVDVSHPPEFKPIHRRNLQRMAVWFPTEGSLVTRWVSGRVHGQQSPCR